MFDIFQNLYDEGVYYFVFVKGDNIWDLLSLIEQIEFIPLLYIFHMQVLLKCGLASHLIINKYINQMLV